MAKGDEKVAPSVGHGTLIADVGKGLSGNYFVYDGN